MLKKTAEVKQLEAQRTAIVQIATNELGVREKTGNNDGEKVEAYLKCVDLKKGQPWCAAYVSWVFAKAGFKAPRSGWSPSLFPSSRLARSALPGNVLGIYFPAYKRIAHVGLITGVDGEWIVSVEGNTNVTGSREGDGVYKKWRHIKTIYRMADWLRKEEGK
ncbi:peptidoglycan-binding protein [Pedobacter sp. AW31-3R]|uniref:peptidoglycan-binding protein n=1 Tax=Pedobacter sp. AW31-3R TaxID=3445781 RepID=UPI003FA00B66